MPRVPTQTGKSVRWYVNVGLYAIGAALIALGFDRFAELAVQWGGSLGWGGLAAFAWPTWVKVALGVVLLDLLHYAVHVLSHHVPWWWRLHKIHHSDNAMDASTAIRHHPLETLVNAFLVLGWACRFTPSWCMPCCSQCTASFATPIWRCHLCWTAGCACLSSRRTCTPHTTPSEWTKATPTFPWCFPGGTACSAPTASNLRKAWLRCALALQSWRSNLGQVWSVCWVCLLGRHVPLQARPVRQGSDWRAANPDAAAGVESGACGQHNIFRITAAPSLI